MAMESHVLFRGPLPSKAALQRAMKELGFPLTLKPATGSLEHQNGFMPMMWRREQTGVEFDVFDGRAAIDELGIEGIDSRLDRCANFRWGGDVAELVAAHCAMTALARLVNGIVLDGDEDKLRPPEEAAAQARAILERVSRELDKTRKPGTSDLKRILKPLLAMRGDLVLIGRRLLIRPVRHLLRGVYFEPKRARDGYKLWKIMRPLWNASPEGLLGDDEIHPLSFFVKQSYFEPLLFDSLAEDVFDEIGKITILREFAGDLEYGERFGIDQLLALLLSGERERARALFDSVEHPDTWPTWAGEVRRLLDADPSELYAWAHVREAAVAKGLKLGEAWKDSPFPGELREGETSQSADSVFRTDPWLESPENIVRELPDRPGEVHYGRELLERKGRKILLTPFSEEEAEERHQAGKIYVIAKCLLDGRIATLRSYAGYDYENSNDPKDLKVNGPKLVLEWHHGDLSVRVDINVPFGSPGLRVDRINAVRKYPADERLSEDWFCSYDAERSTKNIYSRTAGREEYRVPLTDEECRLVACPLPSLGDIDDLIERVSALMKMSDGDAFAI